MKKTKVLSLLLCLSLLCALLVPGPAAHADAADSGMNISKTATANADGSYTITLEAFATGSKTTIVQEKDIPTDIILVLDQSSSMGEGMGDVQYTPYKGSDTRNETNFENRHNGGYANLWHKLPDGSYASVSVRRVREAKYTQIGLDKTNGYYLDYKNKLYTRVNDKFEKVLYTKEYDSSSGEMTYTYKLESGTILNKNNGGDDFKPTFESTNDGHLYVDETNENENVYIYTYTDTSGEHTIGSSTGARESFSPAFYQRGRTTTGEGRLDALRTAANGFVTAVAAKAAGKDSDIATTADNIDHRIAVVGFGSESGNGNNTELLSIAGSNSGSVGVVYNSSITEQNLKDVLQRMDTQDGRAMVDAAINALAAEGTTRTDLGMEMAQRILNANPVPPGETRNRVVIVFTDGAPTNNNGFETGIANSAITTSGVIKAGGTTVYSIGIFPGADASTAGVVPNDDLYDYPWGPEYTEAQMSAACNWFMQNVSSNSGTPRTPSYYLSVGDSASLSSIFQQISGQIQTGGSETTLGSNTVVKDIIAPAFTLSDGETESSIQINTYDCTGKNGNSYTWAENSNGSDGVTATVNGDQVSVTGFNFSENWCGIEKDTQGTETARGRKLVISFTVKLKSGFLGGNDVLTNKGAGIYKDNTTETPVLEFNKPTVNVPIQNVTVTAADENVYLLGNVTADDLKSGATVTVGNVSLDLSRANDTDKPYGLEPWQTEYVDITVTVKDKDGNAISSLTNDTTYTVEVTVSPKTSGSTTNQGTPATEKTGNVTANINVFKPALTFKDSTAYYGDNAPTDYSGSLTTTQWKHGDTLSTDSNVTMTGTIPDLGLTYTPEAGKIASGKINTKQDVPVTAAVSISGRDVTSYTTFEHQACTSDCGWTTPATHGAPAFLLHVKTCTLNITKAGGANDESYVFDVYKDGTKYSEVTVWGNGTETLVELPVGTYTITENTGWRYSASYSGDATLSATMPEGTVTCTNKQNNDQWLNGFSTIVRNIFGQNR